MSVHQPVLLKETIAGLNLKPGQTVVDATVNRAGHSRLIAELLGREGHLIGIDADPEAIGEAREVLKNAPCKVSLAVSNFRELDSVLSGLGVREIDAALFDIGLSSDQLERSGRGFSFDREEPLQMTFGGRPAVESGKLTASEIINHWREESLADIIYGYGGEHFARRIAKAIVEARKQAPIETTTQLVQVIRSAVPVWYTYKRLHFATKTFQALRITVNDELGALKEGLDKAWTRLKPGGRLVVITFHSLEARILKEKFGQKPILPSREEILHNPRARSAQLRIIQKQ